MSARRLPSILLQRPIFLRPDFPVRCIDDAIHAVIQKAPENHIFEDKLDVFSRGPILYTPGRDFSTEDSSRSICSSNVIIQYFTMRFEPGFLSSYLSMLAKKNEAYIDFLHFIPHYQQNTMSIGKELLTSL